MRRSFQDPTGPPTVQLERKMTQFIIRNIQFLYKNNQFVTKRIKMKQFHLKNNQLDFQRNQLPIKAPDPPPATQSEIALWSAGQQLPPGILKLNPDTIETYCSAGRPYGPLFPAGRR